MSSSRGGLDAFLQKNKSSTGRFQTRKRRQEFGEEEEDETTEQGRTESNDQSRDHLDDLSEDEIDLDEEDIGKQQERKRRVERDGETRALQLLAAQGVKDVVEQESLTGKKRGHTSNIFDKVENDELEKFSMEESVRPEREERDPWLRDLAPQTISSKINSSNSIHSIPHQTASQISIPSFDTMSIHSICEQLASCLNDNETVQAAMKRIAPPKQPNRYKKSRRRDAASDDPITTPPTEDMRNANKAQLSLMTDLTSALINRNHPDVFTLTKDQLLKLS